MKKILTIVLFLSFAVAMADCKNPQKDSRMKQSSFLTLASERYSVRKFSDVKVPQSLIDSILEAAKLAPTAVNSQPQMIYVLRSKEAMEKANKISPCIYGAPQAFLICYDDTRACKRGNEGNYGDIDCSIVITHMMLEAQDLGLGSCPVGYFNPEEAKREFNLPANIHPVLLLPFGYPADDAAPSQKHTQYRNKAEMVKEL